jgi:tripartite-type tricarboxylate transporter receptor subunit TctC
MKASPTRRTLLHAGAAGIALASFGARAQSASDWPTRPVTLVVPFPPGGGTDAFARPFGAQFAEQTGQTMVIDNRGGAGGTLGAGLAAQAAPNGYNYFMGAIHHAIAPSVYPKLAYDLEKDFVPVALMARVPQVVVVNPDRVKVGDFKELLDTLRKNPDKFNYASAGAGTSHHLAGELFKLQTGTSIVHVPYRGAGPALQDLLGGNVDMMFDGLGSSAQHLRSGRIKALLVAGKERNPSLPDVPCAAEVGLNDYNVASWYGIWAPTGTPPAIIEAMAKEIQKAGDSSKVRAAWEANGAEYGTLTPAQFGAFVHEEIKRWADVVKAANIRFE